MSPRVATVAAGVFLLLLVVALTGAHKEQLAPAPQKPSFSQDELNRVAILIRASGYSCKTPISMRNMLFKAGFVVHCYGDRPNAEYWFDVEDRGGNLVVSAN